MTVDLKSLQAAFSKIEKVFYHEVSFEINGIPIYLRPVSADEEVAALEYALETTRENRSIRIATSEFFLRMMRGVLSYAIVQIGDLDLRGVETVPTGEVLDNDMPVEREKHEVVEEVLQSWPKPLLVKMFLRSAEMLSQVAEKADHYILLDEQDKAAEIARIESKIEELKRKKESLENTTPEGDWVQRAREATAEYAAGKPVDEYFDLVGQGAITDKDAEEWSKEASEPEPVPEPEVKVESEPETPQEPAPARRSVAESVQLGPPRTTRSSDAPASEMATSGAWENTPIEELPDTFLDEGDPEKSLEAETRRLQQIMQQQQQQQQQRRQHDPRISNLRQATNTTNVVPDRSQATYQNITPTTHQWGQGGDPELVAASSAFNLGPEPKKEERKINLNPKPQVPPAGRNPRFRKDK